MGVPINYYAVLVVAIVNMILGFVWYGPLFGKTWASMMGYNEQTMSEAKAKGMTKTYAIMAIGALVMSYVLAHAVVFAIAYTNITGVKGGLMGGFWNWLGFVAPVTLGTVLWDGKPWKLWAINAGYYLVVLLIGGMILATWTM
jgi:hypothetical protein